MKAALKQLLDDLDEVADTHEEVGDTEVREAMSEAVLNSLLVPQAGYVLPDHFAMYGEEANHAAKRALARFFAHPEAKALAASSLTPKLRLMEFQDKDLRSEKGSYYDDYFGYWEPNGSLWEV